METPGTPVELDLDLIRELFFHFEKKLEVAGYPAIPGFSDLQVKDHIGLLSETGFLHCELQRGCRGVAEVYSLTLKGYEFLEGTRKVSIWNRTDGVQNRSISADLQ